jgi:hypothetical protein
MPRRAADSRMAARWSSTLSACPSRVQSNPTHCSEYVAMIGLTSCRL